MTTTTNNINAGVQDGGLLTASREKLLAGRECKAPSDTTEPGHVARRWHICPVCFPEA